MNDRTVDEFSDPSSWLAVASGQAEQRLSSEPGTHGPALRMDFDFKGGGGFVGARKVFSMRLPEAFAFSFQIRGQAPRNKLEFKLADRGGSNVWRWQQESFKFQSQPRTLVLKNSEIEFAWGPAGGGMLRHLGPVEFIISAGTGGKGTVWLENFRFINRTPGKTPAVAVSSGPKGWRPEWLLGGNAEQGWRSARRDRRPWVQLDFHQAREYGGLVLDWEPEPARRAFTVLCSEDNREWRALHRSRCAEGSRSFVYLPNCESRFLRIVFQEPARLRRLQVQPLDFSRSPIEFHHAVASLSPRGWFPRYLSREQSYWTSAGIPDGHTCAVINEEGLVEPDKGIFSLEPFLYCAGKLSTWADATRSLRLEPGGLAIPTVQWKAPGLKLETTAFATVHGTDAVLYVRYRVHNTGPKALRGKLFVALRPYQVMPPWQAWQGLGGLSAVNEIAWTHGALRVNQHRWVVPLSKPSGFGAVAFEQGVITEYLERGHVPRQSRARDELGFASGAMCFELKVPPAVCREVFIAVPFGVKPRRSAQEIRRLARADGNAEFEKAVRRLRERTGNVSFRMPVGTGREAAQTFRTAAEHILLNRDGPALQPGPRRYTRSWIRDGVLMGAALLRIGDNRALPEFIRWYARFQRKDGFVPNCVDDSGPDWLVEHDSHGEFIYGVMEAFRYTGDRAFLEDMWPHVRKAGRYLERLRARRLTAEYSTAQKIACRGLLPESASHEGYLAHPVHSYWDDAWGLRGLQDAATVAAELGHEGDARDFAALALSFRNAIRASMLRVIADKKLRYVPASVEWADFDPTATSIAVALLQERAGLPPRELEQTYDMFIEEFRRKQIARVPWNNYTAYEIRNISALVRLGRRAEALELLEFFLSDRRPRRWNQWPEISWRNPRSPGHLGDVPHTWIAAEYMLAFASLFAYERESDDALVIGAGVDESWVSARGGIAIQGLPTWHGLLDVKMALKPKDTLLVELGGGLRQPRGGLVIRPPGEKGIRAITVNGKAASHFNSNEAVIREFPARVTLTFGKPRAR